MTIDNEKITMTKALMTSDKFYNNDEAVILIVNHAFPDTVRYSDLQMKNCRYLDIQKKMVNDNSCTVGDILFFHQPYICNLHLCLLYPEKNLFIF